MLANYLFLRFIIICLVVACCAFPPGAQNVDASPPQHSLPLGASSESSHTRAQFEKRLAPSEYTAPTRQESKTLNALSSQSLKPVSKDELAALSFLNRFFVKEFGSASMKELIKRVEECGVDFQMTDSVEGELRNAGAPDNLIEVAHSAYRATPGDAPAPSSATAYFDLLKAAASALKDKQVEKAGNFLEDAIRLDSSLALAYEYLGHIQLYRYTSIKGRDRKADSAGAEANLRKAVERGGHAIFVVVHGHGLGSATQFCVGILIVRKSSITFETAARSEVEFAVSEALGDSLNSEKSKITKLDTPWDARGGFRITVPNPKKPGETNQFRFQAVQFWDDGRVDLSYGHYAKLILGLINDYQ